MNLSMLSRPVSPITGVASLGISILLVVALVIGPRGTVI